MTDARLRDEWLGALKFDGLDDTAWRVFTSALMWSAKNGTDGLIPTRYLKNLHPDGEKPTAFMALIAVSVWQKTADGYQLSDWDGALGQSTAAQVEAYRENARVKQRAYRERVKKQMQKKATPDPSVTGDVTGNATGLVTGHVGKGKGKGKGTSESSSAEENAGWREVAPGQWLEPEPSSADPWSNVRIATPGQGEVS